MYRATLTAAALAVIAFSLTTPSKAQPWSLSVDQNEEQAQPADHGQDRLLIVNGNTGRVIYNDGRDDLLCVTRRHIAYYDYFGRPVFRRTMRCR